MHKDPVKALGFVASLLWGLAACTPTSFPLEITALSVSPEPVVGQVVTLRVEIESTSDEEDVTILLQTPEAVRLMDGTLTWHGSLRAREPKVHRVSVCVLIEGDWRISQEGASDCALGPLPVRLSARRGQIWNGVGGPEAWQRRVG